LTEVHTMFKRFSYGIVIGYLACVTLPIYGGNLDINPHTFSQYTIEDAGFWDPAYSNAIRLIVGRYEFLEGLIDFSIVKESQEVQANSFVRVVDKPLVYPNPFQLRTGAVLGFELSKHADIEIRIYDMRAVELYRGIYLAGTEGGKVEYNRVPIHQGLFFNAELSSGVYFFVLMSEGKMVGKGKFAVMP